MTLEELLNSTHPMQQHAIIKGYQAGAASRDAELSECRNKAIEDCARMAAQGEWKLTIPGKSICAAIRAMKDAK